MLVSDKLQGGLPLGAEQARVYEGKVSYGGAASKFLYNSRPPIKMHNLLALTKNAE
jgi:hypothetical protein